MARAYEIFSCDRWGNNRVFHGSAIIDGTIDFALNEAERFKFNVPLDQTEYEALRPWAREVQLWWEGGTEPIFWGPITDRNINDLKLVEVDVQGPFAYYDKLHFGNSYRHNYLGNGSFEGYGGIAPWVPFGITWNLVNQWGGAPGKQQLNLYQTGGPGLDTFVYQKIRVPGGNYYVITADYQVRTDSQWKGPALDNRGLYVERRSLSGNYEWNEFAQIPETTEKGVFKRLETGIHTFPGPDVILDIRLYATSCQPAPTVNGRPPGSIIWDNVKCVTMESLSFPQSDVATIWNEMIAHSQDSRYQKSSINISSNNPLTGVYAERTFQYSDHDSIGQAMSDMAEEGLLDFGTLISGTSGRTIRPYAPKAGTIKTDVTLELDSEIGLKAVPNIRTNGKDVVTSVIAQVEGQSGPARDEEAAIDATFLDGVIREEIIQTKEHHDSIGNVAATHLETRKRLIETPEVVASPYLIGKVNLGDTLPLIIDADGFKIDDYYRVVATSLDPHTEEYTLTLNHAVLPPGPAPLNIQDEDTLYSIDSSIGTDAQGRGYGVFDIPFEKFYNVTVIGRFHGPANQGGVGWGPAPPRTTALQRGGQTVINLEDGEPNVAAIGIRIWRAE